MVIRECVWDFCAYISCTGDEGQLGSSLLWNGEGVGVGRASVEKVSSQMVNEVADRRDV
jgi:hypothetical protein